MSLTMSLPKFVYVESSPCLLKALLILPQVLLASDAHGPTLSRPETDETE